jgi:hypothetical protein
MFFRNLFCDGSKISTCLATMTVLFCNLLRTSGCGLVYARDASNCLFQCSSLHPFFILPCDKCQRRGPKNYFYRRRIWTPPISVFLIKSRIAPASSTCGWVIKQIPAKVEKCNAELLFWEMLILLHPLNLEQEMTLQRLRMVWGRRSMFQPLSFLGEWRDPNPPP